MSPSRPTIDVDEVKDASYPLEDYALIGDGRSAALVCRNGSIDWLCWPRFDSAACFAALLGTTEHGRWQIAPSNAANSKQQYQTGTMVLETLLSDGTGSVRITDFMPTGSGSSSVVRIVEGLKGTMTLCCRIALRFGYGRLKPWVEPSADGFIAKAGAHSVRFTSTVGDVAHDQSSEFQVSAGDRQTFVLEYFPSHEIASSPADAAVLLEQTQADSRQWIETFRRSTHSHLTDRWHSAIERSLLTLRALIYQPTGGLVAAPTTSLPEKPAGSLNWDYRFCWLRDATFTLTAFLNAGFRQEAIAWRDWMLRAVGADPAKLHIMYRIDGEPATNERALDWLPGYRWAAPVRVGNEAAKQMQVDVYGELLDAMELMHRAGIAPSEQSKHTERELLTHLVSVWNKPGHGVWESRETPRHYTYSRVMAWVGIDRYLKSAARLGDTDSHWLQQLDQLRSRIHAEICSEGYDQGLGTFVQTYGSHVLDASLLLLPIVSFLPADDPRIAQTIAAIENTLMVDGFVMRQLPQGPVSEGAFLACTCWLADCQHMQGRTQEAVATFERVLSVANSVGLISEEYNCAAKHLAGNFPQALTHLAIINTALGLSGPVLQRGGG